MSTRTRPYIVQQGDHLASIAHRLGVDPLAIWGDPRNARLAHHRDPNILCPGDVLFIPTQPDEPLPLTLGSENRFEHPVPEATLRLRLVGAKGAPYARQPCTVEGLAEPVHRDTDDEGILTLQVPVTVGTIRVTLDNLRVGFDAAVGCLDPANEVTGRRMRLRNLGFLPDPLHGEEHTTDDVNAALAAFQEVHGPPEADAWEHVAGKHGC